MKLKTIFIYGYLNYTKCLMQKWQKRGSFFDGDDAIYGNKTHDYRNGNPPYALYNSCTLNEQFWTNLYGNKIYGSSCRGTDTDHDIWFIETDPDYYTGHTNNDFLFKRWVYDKGVSGDQTPLEDTKYSVYSTYHRKPAWNWFQFKYDLSEASLKERVLSLVTNLNGQRVFSFEGEYYPNSTKDVYWITLTKDFQNFVDVLPLNTYSQTPTEGISSSKKHYYSTNIDANVTASDGGAGGSLPADTYELSVLPHYPDGYDTYGAGYGKNSPSVSITIDDNHQINVSWDTISDADQYIVLIKHSGGDWYRQSGQVFNTNYTFSSFPSSLNRYSDTDFTQDYEKWYLHIQLYGVHGIEDSDISQLAYRFNTTNTGDDTIINGNFTVIFPVYVYSSDSDTHYLRAKGKHIDGTWGDYATYSFVYGDTPADVDPVFKGDKIQYEHEDLDTDDTYIYLLVSETSDSGDFLKLFKFNSDLSSYTEYTFPLYADLESARLAKGEQDFYVIYIDPAGTGAKRLFYRRASEDFANEYEIPLPDGYDDFIPDATLVSVQGKDYIITAVYNSDNVSNFYLTKAGETQGEVYETGTLPCTQARLENDPYDESGLWFNFSINNPSYDPDGFAYLTIGEELKGPFGFFNFF